MSGRNWDLLENCDEDFLCGLLDCLCVLEEVITVDEVEPGAIVGEHGAHSVALTGVSLGDVAKDDV